MTLPLRVIVTTQFSSGHRPVNTYGTWVPKIINQIESLSVHSLTEDSAKMVKSALNSILTKFVKISTALMRIVKAGTPSPASMGIDPNLTGKILSNSYSGLA